MKFLIFCSIALLAGTVTCEKNKFNGLVDEVIYEMEQEMINKSQTVVSIPDLSSQYSKKILFFTVDFSANVSGATVKNLSTIQRVGDVVPVQNDQTGTLSVEGTFTMKDLTVHADMLDLKIGFIRFHEPVTVKVGDNAASFKVTLQFDENLNCKTTLNFARVSRLGDFSISLGNSGFLTGVEDDIADFAMDKMAPIVQKSINANLFPLVEKTVLKLNLCNKLF